MTTPNLKSLWQHNYQKAQSGKISTAILQGLQDRIQLSTNRYYDLEQIKQATLNPHVYPKLTQTILTLSVTTHPGRQSPYEKNANKLFSKFATKYQCNWEFYGAKSNTYLHYGNLKSSKPYETSKTIDGLLSRKNIKFAVMFKADNNSGGGQDSQINEVLQLIHHAGKIQNNQAGYILGLGGAHISKIPEITANLKNLNQDIFIFPLNSKEIENTLKYIQYLSNLYA